MKACTSCGEVLPSDAKSDDEDQRSSKYPDIYRDYRVREFRRFMESLIDFAVTFPDEWEVFKHENAGLLSDLSKALRLK